MNEHEFQRRGLSRRDFLRNTSAALVTGAIGGATLGGNLASVAQAREGAPKAGLGGNGFERAGIWFFHPSIFEYALGPWQPSMPAKPDLVTMWKQAIDWFADNGLDYVVLHVAPYGGEANPSPIRYDQVRFGWGYHYTLNFKKFPEAAVFDKDLVKRCQDIVRAVTEYGREKKVDVFFHHYNFMAPKPLIKAHPDLMRFEYLRKGNFIDLNKEATDSFPINPHSRDGNLILNTCWNKPLYRDFMVSCFQEFFEEFPAAAGILVTPGERALCQCIYCIGERSSPQAALAGRYGDSPEKRKTIANFCEVFAKTLDDAGKTPLIRSWINGVLQAPEKWAAALPKGPTYVTKYSVFDFTDTGVDPLSKVFQKAGHNVWLMKEYVGGENAGNIVMTIPKAFDKIAEACRQDRIPGVMGVDNAEWGFTFKSRRVQYVPEILFANSFGHRRRGTPDEVARKSYVDIFGDKGPEILKAVELCSLLPYNIDRVMWEKTEGFTSGFPYHFAPFPKVPKKVPPRQEGWPGSMGDTEMDPPDWARREVALFSEYVKYAETKPWEDGKFRAKITGKGKDPIVFLEGFTRDSKQGLDALKALASQVPPEAKEEMKLLLDSAEFSYLTGVRWTNFLSARLHYAGAGGPNPPAKRKELGQLAVEEYTKGMEATDKMLPILEGFPNTLCDPDMTVKRMKTDISKRHRELGYLKTELAPLLGIAPPHEEAPASPRG